MRPTRIATLLLVLAAVGPRASAQASDEADRARARLTAQLAYLERNPFHEGAFARAVHEAIECGRLATVRAQLTQRLAADEDDRAARVLLARLAARAHEGAQALELLAPLADEEPGLLRLRGELLLEGDQLEPAIAALARAVELCERRLELEELHQLLGRAHLRAGAFDAAEAALRATCALDPESFELRVEVAARLAEAGLTSAAIEELGVAAELARDDPARRVRAEVERGRLAERMGATTLALEAYTRAAELTGPGHWQRAELFARRVALHAALGSLDEFAQVLAADARAQPGDSDLRRFHARALAAAGRDEEVLAVLAQAARDFPSSAEIGRELVDRLEAEGQSERAILELQRLTAARPRETALWRRLGLLLAATEQSEAAQVAWGRALESAPEDVGLALELARLHARFGLVTEAEALYEDALARAPGDLRVVTELSTFLVDQRRGAQVEPLLSELEGRAVERGDAHFLEELAGEWLARERSADAVRALERALEAGGDRRRLLAALVALHMDSRRPERADEPLRELFALARDPGTRAELVERLVEIHARAGRTRTLRRREERALARDPQALLPALLVARARAAEGDVHGAKEPLHARMQLDPRDPDALEHLARLAEARNSSQEAVGLLRTSIEVRPAERRALLERIARVHRRAGNEAALRAVYAEMLASEPESRMLLGELARVHRAENAPEEAVRYLERAVRLDPRDGGTRLDLAALHARLGALDQAREQLLHAFACDDPGLRAKARTEARELAARSGAALYDLELARVVCADEPERFAHAIWLALALTAQHELEAADDALAAALERFPLEPALLEAREELRGLARGATDAPFDARRAARLHAVSPAIEESLERELALGALLITQGETGRARAVLEELRNPLLVAQVFTSHGAYGEAQRALQRELQRDASSVELALRLALAAERDGAPRAATRALEEALRRAGRCFAIELRLGLVNADRHRERGARESGARLLALLDESRVHLPHGPAGVALHTRRVARIERYFEQIGGLSDFMDLGEEALRATPNDAELLEAWLRHVEPRHHRRARALIAHLRQQSTFPAHVEPREWSARLKEHAARFSSRGRQVEAE